MKVGLVKEFTSCPLDSKKCLVAFWGRGQESDEIYITETWLIQVCIRWIWTGRHWRQGESVPMLLHQSRKRA